MGRSIPEEFRSSGSIYASFLVADQALVLYYQQSNPNYAILFVGLRSEEIARLLAERQSELQYAFSLTILASVEAAFRIDFRHRCQRRVKSPVTEKLRSLERRFTGRFMPIDNIFDVWKKDSPEFRGIIGDINTAFRYRDWLAHGRSFFPKFGKRFDIVTVYKLADDVAGKMELIYD